MKYNYNTIILYPTQILAFTFANNFSLSSLGKLFRVHTNAWTPELPIIVLRNWKGWELQGLILQLKKNPLTLWSRIYQPILKV